MGTFFKNWIFNQFPGPYQESDPNKNSAKEGTLQRFLQVFGNELDEDFIPYLDNFMDIVDYLKCDDKFLPLIGSILGYPPSINGDNDTYRKILAYVVAIYKIKGTKRSYEIMFNLLGFSIMITEEVPKKKLTYDPYPIFTYDQDDEPGHYDSDCDYCSGYWITPTWIGDGEMPDDILEKALNIICFLQPINAKFLGYLEDGGLQEELKENITLEFTESVVIEGFGLGTAGIPIDEELPLEFTETIDIVE